MKVYGDDTKGQSKASKFTQQQIMNAGAADTAITDPKDYMRRLTQNAVNLGANPDKAVTLAAKMGALADTPASTSKAAIKAAKAQYDINKDLFNADQKTIGYNVKTMRFIGEYSFIPHFYFNFDNKLMSNVFKETKIYRHNEKGSSTINGQPFTTSLTIVIGSGIGTTKRFMQAIASGDGSWFNSVKYECNFNPLTGVYTNYHTDNGPLVPQYYERVPGQWIIRDI